MKKYFPANGFTLIELMIVVAIISVLVAIALPQFQRFANRSKRVEAIQILAGFHKAETAYFSMNDRYTMYRVVPSGFPIFLGFQVSSPAKYYNVTTGLSYGGDDIDPTAGTFYTSYRITITGNIDGIADAPDIICTKDGSGPTIGAQCCGAGVQGGEIKVQFDDLNNASGC